MKKILIAAILILTPAMAFAQDRIPTPKPKPLISLPNPFQNSTEAKNSPILTGNLDTDINTFIQKLEKIKIDDLKYALALSKASGNKITTPCWQALLDTFTKQNQQYDTNGNVVTLDDKGNPPTGVTLLVKPDPHIFSDVEIASEWLAQLQPDSPISIGCSPMAQAANKSLVSLVGGIISGGASGLFKIPFGLP